MANATKKTIILSVVTVLFAALLFASGLWTAAQPNAFAESWDDFATEEANMTGDGTYISPYTISSAEDLARMSLWVNAGVNADSYYVLDADIDLSGYLFTPIGTDTNRFAGSFNGGGHTIIGLAIDIVCAANNDYYVGLFGVVADTATVQAFGIISGDVGITSDINIQTVYAGSIAGRSYGEIKNVFSFAQLNTSLQSGFSDCLVGGLVGKNNGEITESLFGGAIDIPQAVSAVGGVCGDNDGTLQNIYNSGAIDVDDPMGFTYAGGITGINRDILGNALNAGRVNAVTAGGITAMRDTDTITYCYYDSDLSGTAKAVFGWNDINQDTNKVMGVTSSELFAATPASLNFPTAIWGKYPKAFDGGRYYAPYIISINAASPFYCETAATLRVFGFDRAKMFDTVNAFGSQTNPYIMQTAGHFKYLAEYVNNGTTYADKYFIADNGGNETIDLTGFDNTIGTKDFPGGDKPFQGNFNGNYVVLANYKLDRSSATADHLKKNVGMFGYIGDRGYVHNFTLDDSCSIEAQEFVGSVAGYNAGQIENIETRATVQGGSFVGGLIGFNSTTSRLTDILCVGSVSGYVGASNVYGIIGFGYFQNSANVWYAATASSSCKDTNNRGRALIIDFDNAVVTKDAVTNQIIFGKPNGIDGFEYSITVAKDSTGKISFTGSTESPWDIEYRFADQTKVSNTAVYEPPTAASPETRPVYARLVTILNLRVGVGDKSRLYFSKSLEGGSMVYKTSAKFYRGQAVVVHSEVPEGYYLQRTMAICKNPVDFSEYEDVDYGFEYSNNLNDPGVVVKFTMSVDLTAVRADSAFHDFEAIDAPAAEEKTYDGTRDIYMAGGNPYSVSVPGFLVDYSYSVAGGAPRNVGDYEITINVRSQSGVLHGKETISYSITPRSIVLTEDMLTRQKEYDGSTEPVAVPVINQSGIIGIVPGDAVEVSSTASYDSTDIDWTTASFVFTLRGASAGNYYTPTPMYNVPCEITKRTLIIEISAEHLTYVYDGYAAEIGYFGYVENRGPLTWLKPVADVYMSKDVVHTKMDAVDVGVYDVNVRLNSGPEDYYEGKPITYYYTVQLAASYEFTITPKPVAITYGDYEGLVYNSLPQQIRAYYNDVQGILREVPSACIAYTMVEGTGDYSHPDVLQNAGAYNLLVTLPSGGNYIATAATNTFALSMAKANQPAIAVAPLEGPFIYGDAPRALSIIGSAPDATGAVTYTVLSGYAVIVDNLIEFTGGGDVYLSAYKAGDSNYNEISAPNYRITVTKAVIKIDLEDIEKTYGGTLASLTFIFDGFASRDAGKAYPDGFVEPGVNITGTGVNETVNKHKKYDAGVYTLQILQTASSTGYTFDYSLLEPEPKYTVIQKEVILRPDGKEQIYGNEDLILTYTVYDGTLPFAGSLAGIVFSRESGRAAKYGGEFYRIFCTSADIDAAKTANPNYKITFEEGEYRIVQRTLTLTAEPKSKTYGEADPVIGQPVVSGLAPGETVEDTVFPKNPALPLLVRQVGENAYDRFSNNYGVYYYSSSNVGVSPNYTLVFVSGTLTIYKAQPKMEPQGVLKVPYGDNIETIHPDAEFYFEVGVQKTKLNGTLTWINGGARPTFNGENNFAARFTPAANYATDKLENNFSAMDVLLNVDIFKRPVELDIESLTLTYTGMLQRRLNIVLGNVLEGDDLGETIGYRYAPDGAEASYGEHMSGKAGDYTVKINITNGNYTLLDGETETDEIIYNVKINKAPLLIYLPDIELGEGIPPVVDFIYEGFVNGEDHTALTTQPAVTFHTEAGNFEISPEGATSDNYEITYQKSRQSVTKTMLTSEVQDFTIVGNFDFQTEFAVSEVTKSSNRALFSSLEAKFAPIKSLNKLGNVQISRIYDIGIKVAGENAGLKSVAKATIELPTRLREAKKFYVVLISEDGEVRLAENVVRSGNKLSFDIEDCSMVGIVNPPDYTFIILGCVVVILVIAVFALDMVSERLGIGRHKKKRAGNTGAKK